MGAGRGTVRMEASRCWRGRTVCRCERPLSEPALHCAPVIFQLQAFAPARHGAAPPSGIGRQGEFSTAALHACMHACMRSALARRLYNLHVGGHGGDGGIRTRIALGVTSAAVASARRATDYPTSPPALKKTHKHAFSIGIIRYILKGGGCACLGCTDPPLCRLELIRLVV